MQVEYLGIKELMVILEQQESLALVGLQVLKASTVYQEGPVQQEILDSLDRLGL